MGRSYKYGIGLCLVILLLFLANLLVGSVDIPPSEVFQIMSGKGSDNPSWMFIVQESRLPQALTALLSGCALATCGLILQTAFRNPLADPSILGINSGASLGVAIVMLLLGGGITAGAFSLSGFLAVLAAAFAGAMLILAFIITLSAWIRSHVMLLIAGIMIGYLTSAIIALLNFFATAEGVQSYMIWGLGNFGGVSMHQMPAFAVVVILNLIGALLLIKPLNALLLGERYAENLGVNIRKLRYSLLVIAGLLTAIVTAFCGPISFLGLAVPHLTRMFLGTSNHQSLLPLTMLTGAGVALACNLACTLPGDWGIIPLNAVTPLIGAPVVIYIIMGQRHMNDVE